MFDEYFTSFGVYLFQIISIVAKNNQITGTIVRNLVTRVLIMSLNINHMFQIHVVDHNIMFIVSRIKKSIFT